MNRTQMENRLNRVHNIDLKCLTDSQIEDLYKITDFDSHYDKESEEETLVNWIVYYSSRLPYPCSNVRKILVAEKDIIADME